MAGRLDCLRTWLARAPATAPAAGALPLTLHWFRLSPSSPQARLDLQQQHPLKVYDEDGTLLGEYCAYLLVDGGLIVELKAVREIVDEHAPKAVLHCN